MGIDRVGPRPSTTVQAPQSAPAPAVNTPAPSPSAPPAAPPPAPVTTENAPVTAESRREAQLSRSHDVRAQVLEQRVTQGAGAPVRSAEVAAADAQNRDEMLTHMMRNLPADSPQRDAIRTASASFSTEQLRRMEQGGLIFADTNSVPRDREPAGMVTTNWGRSTHGRYLDATRVVQLRTGNVSPDFARHEMAHAWDDIRNDHRGGDPLSAANVADRIAHRNDVGRTATFSSHETPGLRSAFDAYANRTNPNMPNTGFGVGASVRETLENPREFYAEGFAVFHSGNAAEVGRLRSNAPELYRILHTEAQRAGTLPASAPAP